MAVQDDILGRYDNTCGLYERFCERLGALIDQLTAEIGIHVHSTSSRIKARDSLHRKLSSQGASYASLEEVTDIAGIRIITYFSDEIDQVARMIESEFQVDSANSVDKRAILDPDQFGYLSLHYVVSLSAPRSGLAEYHAYIGLKAEVQVRSILQHAWAEIEHDLGYKTEGEVPREIRRKFSRLAGLLEVADSEFVGIRQATEEYRRRLPGQIAHNPESVLLDLVSLTAFATSDADIRAVDVFIAEAIFVGSVEVRLVEKSLALNLERLSHFGVASVAQLNRVFSEHRAHIEARAIKFSGSHARGPAKGRWVPCGISIGYLCDILASRGANRESIFAYLERFGIGHPSHRERLTEEFVQFARERDL